jgi:EAL domain-containing protein (putative c-di-GMP-specific phosphodiesterase class I)
MNEAATTTMTKPDRDRFVALAFCWGDLLFQLDGPGAILFCAGPVEAFTGASPQQVLGRRFVELISSGDAMAFEAFQKKARSHTRIDSEVLRLKRASGALLDVLVSGYWMNEHFYLALRLRGKARPPAIPKPVGLPEPEAFSRVAGQHIKALEARGETPEMAIIGLDGLEDLRGRLDETQAQAVMASVGSCLLASSVGGDTAVKIGEEAFGLLHDPVVDLGALHDRLADAISAVAPGATALQISKTSMALDVARGLSQGDLTKGLMYALGSVQKQNISGIDVSSISDNIFSSISQGLSDIRDFRRIIDERRFFVALQPIIDIRRGDIHHFEALCRFDLSLPHNSPYQYITLGEETGLIHEFDVAMAAKVIGLFKKLPVNNQKYSIAVNISGFSISVPEYVEALHALLRDNPWTQGRLMFEITESSRITDLDAVNTFIQNLRRNNYKVCLDDFGAGAASFQYLSALEVDVVKIDGSAVRNAQKAAKGRAFLSALTELCARLGVETIAEMVDSPESLLFVRDCGCDYVQGFLFGRPSRNAADFHPLPNLKLFR